MVWPPHFPEACPPDDSIEANGDVYRLVSGKTPKKEDFFSHWIKYPEKRKKIKVSGQACIACGLSVFRSLEDVRRISRRIPTLPKKISVATLDPSMGRMKNTRSAEHYTWWVPVSVREPALLFKNVA